MPPGPRPGACAAGASGCGEWCFLRECFGVPAWGVSADGNVCFVNHQAEELLGVKAEEVVGRPCCDAVAGRDENGEAVCTTYCPVLSQNGSGPVPPRTLRIGNRNGTGRWIQVVPVLRASDSARLCTVEIAVDVNRWARIEAYVKGVAACDARPDAEAPNGLTAREREVLALLSQGLTQHDIAKRLHVSYTTVRTHVQRILPKVGASSIQGAVAAHLLDQ